MRRIIYSILNIVVTISAVPSSCPSSSPIASPTTSPIKSPVPSPTANPVPSPTSGPAPAPTSGSTTYACGPDNYSSGSGGGGSCGICVENCGNEADKVLEFFGLTGSNSDVASISNNNGALTYCKSIESSLVCCGPKYDSDGYYVKNNGWYTDEEHGGNGKQPDVGGVCNYGTESDASSWIICSGDDSETCEGGGDYAERRLSSDFSEIMSLNTFEMTQDIALDEIVNIICHELTLNGNGYEVNGGGNTAIFYISHSSVTINYLTITNGNNDNGGGIVVDGDTTLTLNGVTIAANEATSNGGGIYYSGGDDVFTLHLFDSFIHENNAQSGSGGGIYIDGTAILNSVRTEFLSNYAEENGGGLFIGGDNTKSIDVLSSIFQTNTASTGNGGGYFIYGNSGTIVFSDTSSFVLGNSAGSYGGGFYINGESNSVIISQSGVTSSHNVAHGFYDTSSEIYYSDITNTLSLSGCDESENDKGANGWIHGYQVSGTSCLVSDSFTKGSRTCFSAKDKLTLESGEVVPFRDLNIGDRVLSANLDGELSYSSIVFLPHHDEHHLPTTFIKIRTKGKAIHMTPRHLLPLCSGELMVAHEIEVDSCIRTIDGHEKVIEIDREENNGVYTAIAENEFLVVNGIIASPFASPSAAAHALFNQTDVDEWCKTNNWLTYEGIDFHNKDHTEIDKSNLDPSENCEALVSEMFETLL
mmetsp:Transcript_35144/g.41445  ORF Transcript_35144/g.41445 Transcript_35144/m.41445 type:complete len:701 (-) Transcript_35144:293-2395(-)